MKSKFLLGALCLASLAAMAVPADSTSSQDPPECNSDYKRAIAVAEGRGNTDNLTALLTLKWIPVGILSETTCYVVVLDNLKELGKPEIMPLTENWGVSLEFRGYLSFMVPYEAIWLRHRAELLSGLSPRTGPNGERGEINAYSVNYYGLSDDAASSRMEYRFHPIKWLLVWLLTYGLPATLAAGLWIGFVMAMRSGLANQIIMRMHFIKALQYPVKGEIEIGGAYWTMGAAGFLRHSRFGGSLHNERLGDMGGHQLFATTFGLLSPAFILLRAFGDGGVFERNSAEMMGLFEQWLPWYAIPTVLAALAIYFEYLRRSARQDIWGALVLDDRPENVSLLLIAAERGRRDADEASEKEVLAAAKGAVRRSSVHDQEF